MQAATLGAPDAAQRSPTAGASQRWRLDRARGTVADRHRMTEQRLADARRRALVSAWLRSLSRGR